MKIDKIAGLFSAQNQPAQLQTAANNAQNVQTQDSNEAVRLAKNLGGEEQSARSAKIAELKSAVQSGSYNPDSRQVAAAVYKDLLI